MRYATRESSQGAGMIKLLPASFRRRLSYRLHRDDEALERSRRVDLFIVGVQKAGTTALHSLLSRHDRLEMAQAKELHFFDDEVVDWRRPKFSLLHRHFDWTAQVDLRGESTPIYLFWPGAVDRLRAYNPNARIIVGLRHPTFRAFSHWRMSRSRGAEDLDFETAISPAGRSRADLSQPWRYRAFSYVERGFYAPQIEALLACFPRSQTHFYKTDDLWRSPARTLTEIEAFLGLPPQLGGVEEPEYIVPLTPKQKGAMAPDARKTLDDLYRGDILAAAKLTGLDLADWLDAAYVEPMKA